MKTRSQLFAAQAITVVQEWNQLTGDAKKKRISFAQSFPALIQMCGLLQAIAFADSKSETKDYVLGFRRVMNAVDETELTQEAILNMTALEYMRVSRIALEAATWIKRYIKSIE